jgi:hypothetical protein
MLLHTDPTQLDDYPLAIAYEQILSDPPTALPFWVWLLEDPHSPLSFPGQTDLYRHDCLHLLLKRAFSAKDKAYVVGFILGNDPTTKPWHRCCFKLIARHLYPAPYRLDHEALQAFDQGYGQGQRAQVRSLHQSPVQNWQNISVQRLRKMLGLEFALEVV